MERKIFVLLLLFWPLVWKLICIYFNTVEVDTNQLQFLFGPQFFKNRSEET